MNKQRLRNLAASAGLALVATGMIASAAPAYASTAAAGTAPGTNCSNSSAGGPSSGNVLDPARSANDGDGCVTDSVGPGGPGYNGEDPRG